MKSQKRSGAASRETSMDLKIVNVVKQMPSQLKSVWDSMFEQSEHALRVSVTALRGSLGKLEDYLTEVEREHLASTTTATSGAKAARATTGKKRRRKRRGQFGISEFILAELAKNPK